MDGWMDGSMSMDGWIYNKHLNYLNYELLQDFYFHIHADDYEHKRRGRIFFSGFFGSEYFSP